MPAAKKFKKSRQPVSSKASVKPHVFHQVFSTLEKMILYFAFDFTIQHWKSYFRGESQVTSASNTNVNDSEVNYDQVSRPCIQPPSVPPRNAPRRHVRAKVKTYESYETTVSKKKMSREEKKSPKTLDFCDENEVAKNIPVETKDASGDQEEVVEALGDMLVGKVESEGPETEAPNPSGIANPLTTLLQPFINLWSNSNSSASLNNTDQGFGEMESGIDEETAILDSRETDNLPEVPAKPLSQKSAEEILLESQGHLTDEQIAQLVASEAEKPLQTTSRPFFISEDQEQKLLAQAQAGAQLLGTGILASLTVNQ